MKPKHQRLIFIAVSVVFLCAAVLMAMQAFRENLVFFYSPSELPATADGRLIRIGGLVETGSIRHGKDDSTSFAISDGKATVTVTYRGILPNLFREGQGIVAEGHLKDAAHFEAKTILAKHDESYMPREVVDSLKRSGYWKGGQQPAP